MCGEANGVCGVVWRQAAVAAIMLMCVCGGESGGVCVCGAVALMWQSAGVIGVAYGEKQQAAAGVKTALLLCVCVAVCGVCVCVACTAWLACCSNVSAKHSEVM